MYLPRIWAMTIFSRGLKEMSSVNLHWLLSITKLAASKEKKSIKASSVSKYPQKGWDTSIHLLVSIIFYFALPIVVVWLKWKSASVYGGSFVGNGICMKFVNSVCQKLPYAPIIRKLSMTQVGVVLNWWVRFNYWNSSRTTSLYAVTLYEWRPSVGQKKASLQMVWPKLGSTVWFAQTPRSNAKPKTCI